MMPLAKLRMLKRFDKPLNYKSLIGASLLLLGIASPVFADYVPPENSQPPRGQIISGGRRGGCESFTDLDLIALAHHYQVGQTLSTQPTLTWFVPDETVYPMQLQLYEYDADGWKDVVEDYDIGPSQYGYMSYTIPASLGLEVGGLYSWRVVLMCSDRESSQQAAGAEFEIVSRPAGLDLVEGTRLQQAEQLASAGIWYDAIGLLVNTSLTTAEITYRSQLLMGLAEFEDELEDELEDESEKIKISDRLRMIAEVD